MSFAEIAIIAVFAGIAFLACFVHALHCDIAERRKRECLVR